jgi:hypothetical protein
VFCHASTREFTFCKIEYVFHFINFLNNLNALVNRWLEIYEKSRSHARATMKITGGEEHVPSSFAEPSIKL